MLEILQEEGFSCDSSIQPFSTPLSGIAGSPTVPFYPIIGGKTLKLLEFQPTVLALGRLRLPFSGGFYLRAVPYIFSSWALRSINKTAPGMVYIHPWEFDPEQPRLPAAPLIRLAQYCNLRSTEAKLEKLLNQFQFTTLSEIIKLRSYPAIALKQ